MKPYKEIGKTMKELRLSRNLTQAELAKELGISAATLQRWEKGKIKRAKSLYIVNFADYFNVTLYYFLGV